MSVASANLHTPKHEMRLAFVKILLAAAGPAIVTLLCTSNLTPLGRGIYRLLVRHYLHGEEFRLYHLSLLTGSVLTFVGYLLDVQWWEDRLKIWSVAYYTVGGLFFVAGVLLYTTVFPSIPLIFGVLASIAAVGGLRYFHFREMSACMFSLHVSRAFGLLSAAFAMTWVWWLLDTTIFDAEFGKSVDAWKMSLRASFQIEGLQKLTAMIMWSSPIILSALYFIISMFTLMRSQIHSITDGSSKEEQFVAAEARLAVITLAVMLFLSWVASLLLVNDVDLAKTVMLFSATIFCGIFGYVFLVIGRKRLKPVAETNSTIQSIVILLDSDWFKSAMLLFLWPMLPFYFLTELLHQAMRKQMLRAGILPEAVVDPEHAAYLTVDAGRRYHAMLHIWNKSSVLTKSMYWGLLFFIVKVVFGNGTTMLLSWVNEKIMPWPLWSISLSLFILGICLFLLPPVPGMPIYYVSGIVVTERFIKDGYGFWVGVLFTTLLCMLVKFSAIALEQKAIGEVFSESITVKKVIQVHTPPMKALRHILKAPRLRADKVAVLVGGPDWPTSVLTGILKLRLTEMLLGSLPLVVIIVPIVLATAFQVQAGIDHEHAHQYQALSTIMLMVCTIVQTGALLAAGYYMQAVAEEYKAEIEEGDWEKDPQEAEVLKSIEEDEECEKQLERKTTWEVVPLYLKTMMLLGSLMASSMVYILLVPCFTPFKEFTLTDRISDLPGGNPLSVVNPSGWVAVLLAGMVACVAAFWQVWRSFTAKRSDGGDPGEMQPLLSSQHID